MRKIRIAFFTDILTKNTDGVTRTLFNIIKRIPRDEFEILFITSKPHTRIEDIGWPILYCPALNFPLYPQYQVAFPFFNKRLNQKLNEFNPDIVHFTSPSLLGLFATRYGIHHKKPIVNLYHTHFTAYLKYYFPRIFLTPINGLTNKIIRRIYQPCTITYAPSSPIHKFLIQQGLPKESLRILGRGVNLERFSPRFRDSTTTIKALVSPKLKLLFVGRLVFEKEIKTLVRIYQKLNQINLDVQFIIVGDGPRKTYLEGQMPNAYFSGKLTGKELSTHYASSDVFVFPSTTETFGNVVLEALASGLPVIAANEGGPVDIVQHGINGFLVKPQSEEDFVEKIQFFMDNPQDLAKYKKRALTTGCSWTWEDICGILFDSYRELS